LRRGEDRGGGRRRARSGRGPAPRGLHGRPPRAQAHRARDALTPLQLRAQRKISGTVGRFPYIRIPIRKIFAVARKISRMVAAVSTLMRMNMIIGVKNGMKERTTAAG